MDAAQAVHEKFLAALAGGRLPDRADAPDPATAGLSRADATDIFLSQLTSRQMDRLSRTLQARGEEFFMYCLRRVHRHPPVRPFA